MWDKNILSKGLIFLHFPWQKKYKIIRPIFKDYQSKICSNISLFYHKIYITYYILCVRAKNSVIYKKNQSYLSVFASKHKTYVVSSTYLKIKSIFLFSSRDQGILVKYELRNLCYAIYYYNCLRNLLVNIKKIINWYNGFLYLPIREIYIIKVFFPN